MFKIQKRVYRLLKEEGVEGVGKKLENWKNNFFNRQILRLCRRYIGIERLIQEWVEMEKQIKHEGLAVTSDKLLRRIGVEMEIKGRVSTEVMKAGRPVLVVGLNHEGTIEPFVVASALRRKDVWLISMKSFMLLGKNWAERILPVLPKRFGSDYRHWRKNIENRINLVFGVYKSEKLTMAQIERMNRKTFRRTAKKLEKGGAVMLFVTGGGNIKAKWGRGVGEIISLVPAEMRDKVLIQPVQFEGINHWKAIMAAREAFTKGKSKVRKIQVTFQEPITVSRLIKNLTDPNPWSLTEALRMMSLRVSRAG